MLGLMKIEKTLGGLYYYSISLLIEKDKINLLNEQFHQGITNEDSVFETILTNKWEVPIIEETTEYIRYLRKKLDINESPFERKTTK